MTELFPCPEQAGGRISLAQASSQGKQQRGLTRIVFGNWSLTSGGDAAARVGVPVTRVKILLFMLSAFCATVFAACRVLDAGSAAADRGLLKAFEATIAVVIGGTLLTGGYGSAVGAVLGALILLAAVLLDTFTRRFITAVR